MIGKAFRAIARIFRNISDNLMNKKSIKKTKSKETQVNNKSATVTIIEQPKKEISHELKIERTHEKLMRVFDVGDKVTKAYEPIMDACAWICSSFVEGEEYREAARVIESESEILKKSFAEFSNEVNDFKSFFELYDMELNTTARNKFCKLAKKRASECTRFANSCDTKLKNLFNVSETEKHWFEENKMDVQKMRAPAQKGLVTMSKYASDCIKLYNEINLILANTVIVDE